MRDCPHPSYQAWSYTALLRDFNTSIQDGSILLHPCAYLHNYISRQNDPLRAANFKKLLEESPLFDQHDGYKLCEFINKFIKKAIKRKSCIILKMDAFVRPNRCRTIYWQCLRAILHL